MDSNTFNRLIQEFNENNQRANALREFILDEAKFNELDNLNKDLLISQLKAMEAYLAILSIRIGLNASSQNTPAEINNEAHEVEISE